MRHPESSPLWEKAMEAKFFNRDKTAALRRDDFDQLLGKFAGVSDFSFIAFAEELVEAYPKA
jgi:Sulfotransferase domain